MGQRVATQCARWDGRTDWHFRSTAGRDRMMHWNGFSGIVSIAGTNGAGGNGHGGFGVHGAAGARVADAAAAFEVAWFPWITVTLGVIVALGYIAIAVNWYFQARLPGGEQSRASRDAVK